jgi:hypothetical protein
MDKVKSISAFDERVHDEREDKFKEYLMCRQK